MPKLTTLQKKKLAKYKRLAEDPFYVHRKKALAEYKKLRKMYGYKS